MKLALITYDANHLKTAQVALNLAERPEMDLAFYALPFRERKARDVMFAHRPDQRLGPASARLAHYLGAPFHRIETADAIPAEGFDYYIIVGAPLLPASFVEATAGRVVNAHPGIIPLSRGLDAFKWSIVDGVPLGNTLHFIAAEADAGEIIAVRKTPVFADDQLATIAGRHYELEIDMLSNFDRYFALAGPSTDAVEVRPARMRMPRDVEQGLDAAFVAYKEIHQVR